ncbi:MAG: tail fiber domain-containing protein [Chitinophagales bacterium]|nr:tail fiber domain-containing protein [Bacteroidota bacterium]MCB9042299.1 tail fiber domain-containing protein [Chitinophagales bacterium]
MKNYYRKFLFFAALMGITYHLHAQQVYIDNSNDLNAASIEAYTSNNTINSFGAILYNTGSSDYSKYGLYTYVYNDGAANSFGVYSNNNSWGTADAFAGYFTGNYNGNVPTGFGIYASSVGAINNWAGYFDGRLGVSERAIISSLSLDNNKLVLWNDGSAITSTSTNCYSLGIASEEFKLNVPLSSNIFTFNHGDIPDGTKTYVKRLQTGAVGAVGSGAVGINWLYPGSVTYNIDVNGNGWIAGGTWTGSDRNFKKDIKKYDDALEKIQQLQAYTYLYDQSKAPEYNFDEREHVGYLAQELQKVVPQAVMEDGKGSGYLAVNYDMIIPVISEAVKELSNQNNAIKTENDDLKNKVADLETELTELHSMLQKMSSAMQNCCLSEKVDDIKVASVNNSGARLEQNAPNPFYNKTIIQYYLPDDTRNANLQIVNIEGRVVKTIDLNTTGYGTTTINGNDLTAGTYIYSLVINGRVAASKEMILTK